MHFLAYIINTHKDISRVSSRDQKRDENYILPVEADLW